jgi:hypothetical protein
MFCSDDVILITRDGAPTGFYLPWNTPELPLEVRREVFLHLSRTNCRAVRTFSSRVRAARTASSAGVLGSGLSARPSPAGPVERST